MKKVAILYSSIFFLLQSCAVSRQNGQSVTLESSSDDGDVRDFLDDSGTLNCDAHPRENVVVEVDLTFDDRHIIIAALAATSKENRDAFKNREQGWFVKSLGILAEKVDLKGDNKSISVSESFNGQARVTLEIKNIVKDTQESITGLLSYKAGTKPVLINGSDDTIRGISVFCFKNKKKN